MPRQQIDTFFRHLQKIVKGGVIKQKAIVAEDNDLLRKNNT